MATIAEITLTIVLLHLYLDELDKILYLKQYQSLFDTSMSEFVLCELIEKEIESNFNSSIMKLKLGDEYYDAQ